MTSSDPEKPFNYRLKFIPKAFDEWNAFDGSVKEVLRKALKKRLMNPYVPSCRLKSDLSGCYNIKLRRQGYRLVYTVQDEFLVVLVLAINKRKDAVVYRAAMSNFAKELPIN